MQSVEPSHTAQQATDNVENANHPNMARIVQIFKISSKKSVERIPAARFRLQLVFAAISHLIVSPTVLFTAAWGYHVDIKAIIL